MPAVGRAALVPRPGVVEVGAGRDDGDEEEEAIGGVGVGDGVRGAKDVVLVREGDGERLGKRRAAGRAGEVAFLPAEELAGERREVEEARWVAREEAAEGLLLGGDVAVGDAPGGGERGRRDDEPDRLDVAEPLLVGAEGGVPGHQEGLRGRSVSRWRSEMSSWERDLPAGTYRRTSCWARRMWSARETTRSSGPSGVRTAAVPGFKPSAPRIAAGIVMRPRRSMRAVAVVIGCLRGGTDRTTVAGAGVHRNR